MKRYRGVLLLTVTAALAAGAFCLPRTAQSPDYHLFADARTRWGVPNALNVLSNLPFALVGLLGIVSLGRMPKRSGTLELEPSSRAGYLVFFSGVLLTAFGSAYYHLAPDNPRLVWDRLPMTLAFAGLLAGLVAERIEGRLGRALVGPLAVLGIASVLYWRATELHGRGDLRPYALMQFGPLILLPLILALYPARNRGTGWLLGAFFGYALAKVLETADGRIFGLGLGISGHSLKHLVAALAILCVERSLHRSPGPLTEA